MSTFNYGNVAISWLGHDAFLITCKGQTVCIDPYNLKTDIENVDIVLVTHEHFDHCSEADLKRVIDTHTVIITTRPCREILTKRFPEVNDIKAMLPFESVEVYGIKVESVPAYNLNKFKSPGIVFHPKEDKKLGFIINIGGKRIYHAGDTDCIPEMKTIRNIDVAMLPVSGTYVMTAEEAAKAVDIIKPRMVIPMHYGGIVGSRRDAERLAELTDVDVEILD